MDLRVGNITFDCNDVLKVANFWSAAIGRPLDQSSNVEFASIGGSDPERAQPAWYFNKVPERKRAKNRVHLDLFTPNYPTAVEQLIRLGATVIGEHELRRTHHRWTVMHDPEGNEFCIAAKAFTGF